jgi:hypothetical protein
LTEVWIGSVSRERLCIEIADMYPACLIGSRAVALMGIPVHDGSRSVLGGGSQEVSGAGLRRAWSVRSKRATSESVRSKTNVRACEMLGPAYLGGQTPLLIAVAIGHGGVDLVGTRSPSQPNCSTRLLSHRRRTPVRCGKMIVFVMNQCGHSGRCARSTSAIFKNFVFRLKSIFR